MTVCRPLESGTLLLLIPVNTEGFASTAVKDAIMYVKSLHLQGLWGTELLQNTSMYLLNSAMGCHRDLIQRQHPLSSLLPLALKLCVWQDNYLVRQLWFWEPMELLCAQKRPVHPQ